MMMMMRSLGNYVCVCVVSPSKARALKEEEAFLNSIFKEEEEEEEEEEDDERHTSMFRVTNKGFRV